MDRQSHYEYSVKENLEKMTKVLEEYEKNDSSEFPAYTFLLPDVMKVYDICPYLSLTENVTSNRKQWLENTFDKGEHYRKVKTRIVDSVQLNNIVKELAQIQSDLDYYVEERIDDTSIDERYNYVTLMEAIKLYKEAKSKNKKIKEMWENTLQFMDFIGVQTGIDFAKYMNITFNVIIKYKMPSDAIADPHFIDLCLQVQTIKTNKSTEKLYRERQIEGSKIQLVELINKKFRVEQNGKYYKRWTALNDAQKLERLLSYCDWYGVQNSLDVQQLNQMKTSIREVLEKSQLKNTDVIWSIKSGVVTDINIIYDEQTNTFSRNDAKAKTEQSTRRKSVKKKQTTEMHERYAHNAARANRLLLFHVLFRKNHKKDDILSAIAKDFNPSLVVREQILPYLSSQYDHMIDTILKNPYKGVHTK